MQKLLKWVDLIIHSLRLKWWSLTFDGKRQTAGRGREKNQKKHWPISLTTFNVNSDKTVLTLQLMFYSMFLHWRVLVATRPVALITLQRFCECTDSKTLRCLYLLRHSDFYRQWTLKFKHPAWWLASYVGFQRKNWRKVLRSEAQGITSRLS